MGRHQVGHGASERKLTLRLSRLRTNLIRRKYQRTPARSITLTDGESAKALCPLIRITSPHTSWALVFRSKDVGLQLVSGGRGLSDPLRVGPGNQEYENLQRDLIVVDQSDRFKEQWPAHL